MAKKYSYKDDFDMLILRHDYMNRVEDVDPNWIKEFEPMVVKTSWIMFDKFRPQFSKMGYEIEDVINVTNCYMIAYMSIYSMRRNPESKNKVMESYNKRFGYYPSDEYIVKKEKINMISFLRQKLQHAALICSRKLRNITVDTEKSVAYAFTDESSPISETTMFREGEAHGYRKLSKTELKEIEKLAKKEGNKQLKDKDGYDIIKIEIPNEGIETEDYRDLFISSKNDMYHRDPEACLNHRIDNFNLENYRKEFNNMKDEEKKMHLTMFIDKFKGNKRYKVELREARKKLSNM